MFKKGDSKPALSGRKKGSLNKKTILSVDQILADKDINPTEEILKLIPTLSDGGKIQAWFELLSYTQAKPKPSEDTAKDASDDEVLTMADILEMVDVSPVSVVPSIDSGNDE